MSKPSIGLSKTQQDVVVAPTVFPCISHKIEDWFSCWLLVVDEVGTRKKYIVRYDRSIDGQFEVAHTLLGDREVRLNHNYIVHDEEVHVWEEITRHDNKNFPNPLRRFYMCHPEVNVYPAPEDKQRSAKKANELFTLVWSNHTEGSFPDNPPYEI